MARAKHLDGCDLLVVAELLGDPFGAACTAVGVQGHQDGPPDLAGVQFIATLQRRHDQRVGMTGGSVR